MYRRFALILAFVTMTTLVAAQNEETLSLVFKSAGHTTTAKNPSKWPYQSGDTAKIAQTDLVKLVGENKLEAGTSWEADAATVTALFNHFEKSADKIAGTMKLTVKEVKENIATLDAEATVVINATEGGGKGKRNVEAKLAGTLTYDGGAKKVTAIALDGKEVKVSGTWDAGQWGIQELTGEGTISLAVEGAKTDVAKKDPEAPKFGPGAKPPTGGGPGGGFGGGPGGGGFGGGGMPNIDKELLFGQAVSRINVTRLKRTVALTEEQEEKIKELLREYGSSFGSIPQPDESGKIKLRNPNEIHTEAVEKIKAMLTDEQKPKFDEYLAKMPGGGNSLNNQNNQKSGQGQDTGKKEEPKKEEPKPEEKEKEM